MGTLAGLGGIGSVISFSLNNELDPNEKQKGSATRTDGEEELSESEDCDPILEDRSKAYCSSERPVELIINPKRALIGPNGLIDEIEIVLKNKREDSFYYGPKRGQLFAQTNGEWKYIGPGVQHFRLHEVSPSSSTSWVLETKDFFRSNSGQSTDNTRSLESGIYAITIEGSWEQKDSDEEEGKPIEVRDTFKLYEKE